MVPTGWVSCARCDCVTAVKPDKGVNQKQLQVAWITPSVLGLILMGQQRQVQAKSQMGLGVEVVAEADQRSICFAKYCLTLC